MLSGHFNCFRATTQPCLSPSSSVGFLICFRPVYTYLISFRTSYAVLRNYLVPSRFSALMGIAVFSHHFFPFKSLKQITFSYPKYYLPSIFGYSEPHYKFSLWQQHGNKTWYYPANNIFCQCKWQFCLESGLFVRAFFVFPKVNSFGKRFKFILKCAALLPQGGNSSCLCI